MRRWFWIAASLCGLWTAAAAGAASLGEPTYGGAGCPAGTASVRLAGTSLTVRYSAYRAAAGGSTGKRFDRKACALSLPVAVGPGEQVAIVGADYRGRAKLPAGAKAEFRAEFFFAGAQGPAGAKSLAGPADGPFKLSTGDGLLVWSPCGEDVILRSNSSLRVTTANGKPASVSVRSQDLDSALVYRLKRRKC